MINTSGDHAYLQRLYIASVKKMAQSNAKNVIAYALPVKYYTNWWLDSVVVRASDL